MRFKLSFSKQAAPPNHVGYVTLLRRNRNFRYLWIGQIISQAGDWFNSVALFTLLLRLTGSGQAIALTLLFKLLPTLIAGPLAGVVADDFNRKTIMIIADLTRGCLVLALLFIRRPEQVWLVYLLTASGVVGSAFFETAKSAAVPSVVTREELLSANTLASGTWSVMLALGAALGGFVTNALGTSAAFALDSLTFFASALCVVMVSFPQSGAEGRLSPEATFSFSGISEPLSGIRYLWANPFVLVFLSVKTAWSLCSGGMTLLLATLGGRVFPLGKGGSISIGFLYAACGVGAILGPVLAQRQTGEDKPAMYRAIGLGFLIVAFFGGLFPWAKTLAMAALFSGGLFLGGNVVWVFSTTLLQRAVPDTFRGCVFALEIMGMTLAGAASTFLTGWMLDHLHLKLQTMAALLGGVLLLPGGLWVLFAKRHRATSGE